MNACYHSVRPELLLTHVKEPSAHIPCTKLMRSVALPHSSSLGNQHIVRAISSMVVDALLSAQFHRHLFGSAVWDGAARKKRRERRGCDGWMIAHNGGFEFFRLTG